MEVKYFMWGYQSHFQSDVVITATRVLKALDSRFEPDAFLVGFKRSDTADGFPICVEPDYGRFQPEHFASVADRAKLLMASDAESKSFHTHPIAQERHLERIRIRGHQNAIQEIVDGETHYSGMVNFVTGPIEVDKYSVYIVLQVQKHVYDSIYRLKISSRDWYSITCSLLDATIDKLLGEFVKDLTLSSESGFMRLDHTELLRTAAKSLMYTPAAVGNEMNGLHGLYEACEAISTMTYEGADGVGTIAFSKRTHPAIRLKVELTNPVPLRDFGAVRKLLHLASGRMTLFSDSYVVYGLGEVLSSYDPSREDLFTVYFRRKFVWDLAHANWTMMHVRFGQPELKVPGFNRHQFETDAPRTLDGISTDAVKHLADLIGQLASGSHGALLIISADAQAEASRLKAQGMPVTPFRLTADNISWATSIDGAVLADFDGTCYAIGVILDGMASERCVASRGARFNSAIRYVYSEDAKAGRIAVVRSEDGAVDVLPKLRPQIRRSEFDNKLKEFRELTASDEVLRRLFGPAMRWFEDHRFYLSPEQCEEINELRKVGEEKLEDKESGFRLIYNDLVVNPEMNDSYLID